jgi:CRP-like cAMP-binding protein
LDHLEIYQRLSKIQQITDEAWSDFGELFEDLALSKNEYLIREGERAYFCYFLVDGVVRVYFSKDGNDYNKTFFIPGTFPTPLTALLTNAPAQLNFQALTPCQLIRFTWSGFRGLFDRYRCLESFLRKVLEAEWIKKERHDIRMVTNDATTNYLIFRKEFPDLENLIPQYHIASYLGITPIQLSRIRARLVK